MPFSHVQLIHLAVAVLSISLCHRSSASFISTNTSLSHRGSGSRRFMGAVDVAHAMNSEDFLKELVLLKNTADVRYYTSADTKPALKATGNDEPEGCDVKEMTVRSKLLASVASIVQRRGGAAEPGCNAPIPNQESASTGEKSSSSSSSKKYQQNKESVCEYIGRLWFLGGKGMKFRESLRVLEVAPDATSASIECKTEFHNGRKWLDCSRVVCELSLPDSKAIEDDSVQKSRMHLDMRVDSELLVRIPIPGVAGAAVRRKIQTTFQDAAMSFFRNIAGGESERRTTSHVMIQLS